MRTSKPLPACEQEVTITWSRGDTHASIYSSDTNVIARLEKMRQKYPDVYVLRDIYPDGLRFKVPVRLIRFGAPASDAQKEKGRLLAERNRKGREKA